MQAISNLEEGSLYYFHNKRKESSGWLIYIQRIVGGRSRRVLRLSYNLEKHTWVRFSSSFRGMECMDLIKIAGSNLTESQARAEVDALLQTAELQKLLMASSL
jgi:hypothetical protein